MKKCEKIRLTGLWLFALGIAALGIQGVSFLSLFAGLQPVLPDSKFNIWFVMLNGGITIIGGLAIGWPRSRTAGGLVIALVFGLSFVALQLPTLLAAPILLTSVVAPTQCLVIAATGVVVAYPVARPFLIRLSGAMLLLFGAVHLSQHGFISSLIPEWMPIRQGWPWLTGTAMILAGFALSADKLARQAAVVIAAMFLLWLPLLHLGRIVTNPGSSFEWMFATTAVILAGCLLLAVGADKDREVAAFVRPAP